MARTRNNLLIWLQNFAKIIYIQLFSSVFEQERSSHFCIILIPQNKIYHHDESSPMIRIANLLFIYCYCTHSITAYTWLRTGGIQANPSKIAVSVTTFTPPLEPISCFPVIAALVLIIATWHWACYPHQNISNEFIWRVFRASVIKPARVVCLKFRTSVVTVVTCWSKIDNT